MNKPKTFYFIFSLFFLFLLPAVFNLSIANDIPVLKTVDTKSPQDTLRSFLESTEQAFTRVHSVRNSYLRSSRYFLSDSENKEVVLALAQLNYAKRTLDLSDLPGALAHKLGHEKVLLLIEIFARIKLPNINSVPDISEMEAFTFKRWTIPETDITIERVEKGSRAGEYLFSSETTEQLYDFYQRIKYLPSHGSATSGSYESYRYGGSGLRGIIPYRWLISLPGWLTFIILDQPVWRWIGILLLFLTTLAILKLEHQLARIWVARGKNAHLRQLWAKLIKPITLIILIPIIIYILTENLRISDEIFTTFTLALWAIFTLVFTGVVWSAGSVIAETMVNSQRLLSGSIDSQLIRLTVRLTSSILAIAVLVAGAQQLGIPAYSIITGLGVGGVALALAAKDSLANLIGSLLIMFEKPFRVGHWIKIGDTEGVVENIGFRNTSIRTFYNSVLSIPSNTLVNTVVDNMSMREQRRIRTTLTIEFNTDAQKIEDFVAQINDIIINHQHTSKNKTQIIFRDFNTYGLEILVSFFLNVNNYEAELRERQNIMMAILKLADSIGIVFAIPIKQLSPDSTLIK